MKKFKNIVTIVSLVGIITASFTGCGVSNSSVTSTTNTDTTSIATNVSSESSATTENVTTASTENLPKEIRLGYWESPNGELLVKETKALEQKYPDTKITWIQFESGSDILTAIQGGSIDIATIGTPPGALGIANGLPYKIFYLHDIIGESEGLIVKADSGINSVKDLAGKKIATTFGTTSHFSLVNALHFNGLQEKDLTLYDMQAPNIYAAWERGDIDGAYIWESTKSKLLNDGGKEIISSKEVADLGSLTGEMGIVANNFYSKYPNVISDYIDLLDQAVNQYKSAPEESAKLMAAGLGLTEEEALTSMNEIIVLTKQEQTDSKYFGTKDAPGNFAQILKDTADYLVTQGSLKSAPDVKTYQDSILTELY